MGLSTRELLDPHWLLWCDSSSPDLPGFGLRTRLVRVRLVWLHAFHRGPLFFRRVFVNITEPQRVSAYSIQDSCVSNSSVLPPMPTASWGGRRRFGPLTRLTARHQSPRLAYHGGMPDPSLLETFPNPGDAPYVIEHLHEEFTSVCPKTGHPDFGEILFRYEPAECCVELKSLKMYCQSFRQEGIYYEAVTNRLRDDMVACMQPRWLQIVTMWKGRGGFKSTVVAEFGDVPECWKRP